MGDDRPAVYWEDDNLIIRASGVGHPCLWELIATGQNLIRLPYPAILIRAFAEGNLLEPVIIKQLEHDYMIHFLSHQTEGELWLSDDCAIRYHPDGIANLGSDAFRALNLNYNTGIKPERTVVVEAKALTDSLWQKAHNSSTGDVLDEYNWQLSAMMHDTGYPGLWAVYNKGLPPDADGNREPCEDAGKLHLEYVETPPVSLDELKLKATLIKNGVEGELLLETERPCDSPDHWPCLYLHLRPQADAKERTVLHPDNPEEVDQVITTYLTFKGQYDESEKKYKEARDQLVQIAGDAGYIQTDKFYVPIVQGTSTKMNWSAMGKQLKEVFEQYKVKGKYKYVRGIRRLQ